MKSIEEKADAMIGQFWPNYFEGGNIKSRKAESIKHALTCVHSILDELGELRNSFKEIYGVCPGALKSKINEMVDLRHEIEKRERIV